jgi:hypothetical protein
MKTLLTLLMALLCQVSMSQSVWVGQVLTFNQGLNNDSGIVSPLRSNISNCIGVAQASDTFTTEDDVNFLSLGFGGELTVMMESPIKNIEGMDFKIHETTFGTPNCKRYPEKVMVFASQDNCNWSFCDYGCQDSEFDLGNLTWAKYIKVIDVSPYGNFDPFGVCDGYDVDGIEGYSVETETIPTDLVPNSAQQVVSFKQGPRKNGTPVALSRSNPENALGLPQGTESVNFVSLGFGGQLILKFDFVVFNREGFDFKITETTFGNPQCEQYPEKSLVEVSMDYYTWYSLDVVCLDGMVEMGDVDCFQYIKITDRSPLSLFNGSADGYDVDGVFSFNNCDLQSKVDFDDIVTMDEESDIVLSPNPFEDKISINNNDTKNVIIYNYLGSKVKELNNVTDQIDVIDLPKGIYYLDIISEQSRTTHKLFKK